MKPQIIEILGTCKEPELIDLQADQIIDLFQKNKPTPHDIHNIVDVIAYDELGEDHDEDFAEKVWRFKQFLKKHYGF